MIPVQLAHVVLWDAAQVALLGTDFAPPPPHAVPFLSIFRFLSDLGSMVAPPLVGVLSESISLSFSAYTIAVRRRAYGVRLPWLRSAPVGGCRAWHCSGACGWASSWRSHIPCAVPRAPYDSAGKGGVHGAWVAATWVRCTV